MCNHDMTYMLKEYDGVLAGTMLEIDGVISSGKSKEELTKNLHDQTLSYFKAFADVHDAIRQNEKDGIPLQQIMRQSISGKMVDVVKIKVVCPPAR